MVPDAQLQGLPMFVDRGASTGDGKGGSQGEACGDTRGYSRGVGERKNLLGGGGGRKGNLAGAGMPSWTGPSFGTARETRTTLPMLRARQCARRQRMALVGARRVRGGA